MRSFRGYDILSADVQRKGSVRGAVGKVFGGIGRGLGKANRNASRLGIVGWAILITIIFVFLMFMVNKLAGPELKFTSETVANVVRLRDGAEASMDFVMLWTLFFFLLSVINDLWSMDYSQGPIKN